MKFEVRSVPELANRVLPHFKRHPLRSGKRRDYERFAAIVQSMHEGAHLTEAGFMKIVKLAEELNSSGTKRYARSEIRTVQQMNA